MTGQSIAKDEFAKVLVGIRNDPKHLPETTSQIDLLSIPD